MARNYLLCVLESEKISIFIVAATFRVSLPKETGAGSIHFHVGFYRSSRLFVARVFSAVDVISSVYNGASIIPADRVFEKGEPVFTSFAFLFLVVEPSSFALRITIEIRYPRARVFTIGRVLLRREWKYGGGEAVESFEPFWSEGILFAFQSCDRRCAFVGKIE